MLVEFAAMLAAYVAVWWLTSNLIFAVIAILVTSVVARMLRPKTDDSTRR